VLLGAANLFVMRRITRAMTGSAQADTVRADPVRADTAGAGSAARGDGGGSAVWALALPVKLITLVGVAYLLVQSGVAQAIPLAVGFAVLPLTSVFLPQPSSVRGRA
jgi:hypothetical protein